MIRCPFPHPTGGYQAAMGRGGGPKRIGFSTVTRADGGGRARRTAA